MVDPRKQDEAEFHDKLRNESLKYEDGKYRYLTSNRILFGCPQIQGFYP